MTDYMKEAERLMRQYTTAVLEKNSEATAFYHSALLAHIQRGAAPEGWKEATIAWEVCASIHREYAKKKDPFFTTRQADFVKHTEAARAALLAHIQRGVPEGNERDEWESVVFTLMGHAASLYFLGQSDMPNWFYELAEKLARRHVDEALAARVREVGIQQRAALAAAPDQFRDATKMMAVQPSRMTCTAPAPAEVPMPEPTVSTYEGYRDSAGVWHPMAYSADQMRTYGAACRDAGYARGLAEAGRDAERYRTVRLLATAERDPLPDYEGDTSSPGAFDASIDHATAALRGEVKP